MFRLNDRPTTFTYNRKVDANKHTIYSIVVDQFPAQDFNKGKNGFPANDISLLMRAQTDKEFELIAARLQASKVNNPDTKGMTDKQILRTLIPSWVQSPAEIEKFMDWYNKCNPVDDAPVKAAVENTSINEPANED